MKHEMQHPDSPTWCIHCGGFDVYCGDEECGGTVEPKFDSRVPENFERMLVGIFGERKEGRV